MLLRGEEQQLPWWQSGWLVLVVEAG
jgi:hypothetical protein